MFVKALYFNSVELIETLQWQEQWKNNKYIKVGPHLALRETYD